MHEQRTRDRSRSLQGLMQRFRGRLDLMFELFEPGQFTYQFQQQRYFGRWDGQAKENPGSGNPVAAVRVCSARNLSGLAGVRKAHLV